MLGAWDGWTWAQSQGDPLRDAEAFEEVLTVGRLRNSGLTVIIYRGRVMEKGQLVGRLEQVIRLVAK
jgi:hypothetical protein